MNHYRVAASEIRIRHSAQEKNWGDNLIPAAQVVPPYSQLRHVRLPPARLGEDCLWDVGAIFDNEAQEIITADICKNPNVTLTGRPPGALLGTQIQTL